MPRARSSSLACAAGASIASCPSPCTPKIDRGTCDTHCSHHSTHTYLSQQSPSKTERLGSDRGALPSLARVAIVVLSDRCRPCCTAALFRQPNREKPQTPCYPAFFNPHTSHTQPSALSVSRSKYARLHLTHTHWERRRSCEITEPAFWCSSYQAQQHTHSCGDPYRYRAPPCLLLVYGGTLRSVPQVTHVVRTPLVVRERQRWLHRSHPS